MGVMSGLSRAQNKNKWRDFQWIGFGFGAARVQVRCVVMPCSKNSLWASSLLADEDRVGGIKS